MLMNVGNFLIQATRKLQKADIATARLDCLIVLEDLLGKDRATLLAHPELEIPAIQMTSLNNFITQREKHLPLAYYRGKSAFFGRNFIIDRHVLVPRPESESIINLLLKCSPSAFTKVADIGTGSGCLGITAALDLPNAPQVFLYDNDAAALKIAKRNVAKYGTKNVHVKQQDLLTHCNEHFDVLLANLPYVPKDHPINRAAMHEPQKALYSGPDGLDHYRKLWKQVEYLDYKPVYIVLESFPEQHATLKMLAAAASYKLEATEGYARLFTAKAL